MTTLNRERLRELIELSGKSPRALSRELGTNDYLLRDILSGRSKNPRSDTVSKIAEALGTTMGDLLSEEDGTPNAAEPKIAPRFLLTRYRVQAGLWFEVGEDEPTSCSHPVVPDPRFGNWPQWLEEVVGDSINEKIPHGGFAHVVDTIEMGYAPRNGDFVVIERSRDGGLRERSIKQIVVTPQGQVEFWPRSTNPKWSTPLKLNDAPGVEANVVGLVIGSYMPF